MKFDIDKTGSGEKVRISMRKLVTALSISLVFIYSYSQLIALALGWYYSVAL